MNKSLLLLTESPYPNIVYTYILLGLYYGILMTLPVGPSQILCLRSFLLSGNLSGLISLSGLFLAQIIIILSIYCSPIYLLISRPHTLTLVSLPYMAFFCLTFKDFQNYHTFLRPTILLRYSKLARLFLVSFLFQILNPIIFPNPVLTRLIYLHLFRYSTNKIYIIASVTGWLFGQVAFNYLSRLLLTRMEKDSPIPYLLTKRSIYLTFSIVLIYQSVTYLGRAPVPFLTKKFLNESEHIEMTFWDIAECPDLFWSFFRPWPNSFFDPARINRSNRFVKNNKSDNSFYKRRTSTYFFSESLIDGKERLSFASLPSLSIFDKWVYRSMKKYPRSIRTRFRLQDWVYRKMIRIDGFQKELTARLKQLDTHPLMSKMIVLRTRLTSIKKTRIPRTYDPRVNKSRTRIPISQTFLSATELGMTPWEWVDFESNRRRVNEKVENNWLKNSLRDWISEKNSKLRQNETPQPWETLPSRSRRIFQFLFKNRVLFDYEIQNILKEMRSSSTPNITWEEITNLEHEDQVLFFTYLQSGSCHQIDSIFSSTGLLITNIKRLSNLKKKIRRLHKVENLSMDLARNIEIYLENLIDIPGIEGDFRQRKTRNMGVISVKGKPRSLRIVRRYAKISDFRRRLLKGSMRSRRRKIVLWKFFQDKIRSPFFLRSLERPILIKPPIEQHRTTRFISLVDDKKKYLYFKFDNQLPDITPIPSSEKRSFINESKLVRSAVAARSDIGSIHNGRGYMLIFQSKFRKFIKIPVLIIIKNLGRMLLHQRSEWNKDWTNWRKETHINCTFDGEEVSQEELPPRWLREGIQIKIVYPFHLKPWYTHRSKKLDNLRQKRLKTISKDPNIHVIKKIKRRKPKFTYLTVLGYQTDLPFGTIQKETPFWKPVRKKIIRICKRSLSCRFKHVYPVWISRLNWGKISKANSISSEEKNHILKFRRSVETTIDSVSKKKDSPFNNSIDYFRNYGQYTVIKYGRSIAIGGEIHSVTDINKKLISTDKVKEIITTSDINNALIDFATFLSEFMETDELYIKRTSNSLVPDNPTLNDVNLIDFEKTNWKQPLDTEEVLLGLDFVCHELVDKIILIVMNLSDKIHRISGYYSNSVVSFFTRLKKMLHHINWKNNLLGRNLLSRFQLSSQASLYAGLWEIGMMDYLDLDMLIHDYKSISRYAKKNQFDNSYNTNSSWLGFQQSKLDIKESCVQSDIITTQFRSFLGKTNHEETSKITIQNFTDCVERWGGLNRFENLNKNNWNEWLNYLHRYKLPSSIWYSILPKKWEVHLNRIRNIKTTTRNFKSFQSKLYCYSLYEMKPSLRYRIGNLIKLRKHKNILQTLNDCVQNGDIQNLFVQQAVIEQKSHRNNHLQLTSKIRGRWDNKFVDFWNPGGKEIYNLQFDLMSWLDLNVVKTTTFFNFKRETRKLKDSLLEDSDQCDLVFDISRKFQTVTNELYEIMLDDREDTDFIFRWKCKFEVELEKMKSLIALIRTLGEEHDLVKLCRNTEVNSDLLNFYFSTTDKFDLIHDLFISSSHRLPIIFDDQDLLFKILQPLLGFNVRFKVGIIKKRLNKKVYNAKYISNVSHIFNDWKWKNCCIYNIDDLLLPRRRWEFRFLRCLLLSENLDMGISPLHNRFFKTGQTFIYKNSSLHHVPRPIGIQRIKRFLWPSFRLEEVACTSRFCLSITNGNPFAALRIRMYPFSLS
uniref:photosystem I assembly protein ycf1 n=1 Tax=Haplopteris ensiformis TaxID=38644 RepID=UPI00218211A1|nr:photosystem I assembly protein ycf1 [Haplopteris ensiformis]UQV94553.1 photosystem I assembly protein ycf1 [Haplopteris ensiformis]